MVDEDPDVQRVIRDFAVAAPGADDTAWIEALSWSVSVVDGAFRVFVTAPEGTAFGFGARREGRLEAAVCDAADRIQDFVVDNLRIGLPPVPGTVRPAAAKLVDGEATWTDPKTGWRCRIGDYPEP